MGRVLLEMEEEAKLSKILAVQILFLLFRATTTTAVATTATQAKRPHIIVIVADDLVKK